MDLERINIVIQPPAPLKMDETGPKKKNIRGVLLLCFDSR